MSVLTPAESVDDLNLIPSTDRVSPESIVRVLNEKQMVHKIVLTGGPCAGKTTSMERLTEHFEKLGYRVYVVPEVATLMFTGGVRRCDLETPRQVFHFQENMIKIMMALEDGYYSMAKDSGQKSILFCDRGTLDCFAYMDKEVWQAILDENGWSIVQLRDKRYDCVVHLITAAIGAEAHYTNENLARAETPEEARDKDEKLRQAWVGHPYLVVVDNSTGFEEKLERVVDVVTQRLEGRKESQYSKRKYLLNYESVPPSHMFPVAHEDFYTEYIYLRTDSSDDHCAIRKRGNATSYTYTLIARQGTDPETRKSLTGREYVTLLKKKDNSRHAVIQKRRYFLWDNKCFHIDWFVQPKRANEICFLQVYAGEGVKQPKLPDFLQVGREVTDERDYSMFMFSDPEYNLPPKA
eukprot:GCRY01000394.1.p1 GENE.GCRY01000394.1~~GCRY01000394.1.p1  ORF type:complete len:408 (-),score=41.38 GCRY01000394.1:317-1540(-)